MIREISPLISTSGAVNFKTFKIAFPRVDFPEPDSPTIPKVSPLKRSIVTFLTACTASTFFCNRPPKIGKSTIRLLTFRIGLFSLISEELPDEHVQNDFHLSQSNLALLQCPCRHIHQGQIENTTYIHHPIQ